MNNLFTFFKRCPRHSLLRSYASSFINETAYDATRPVWSCNEWDPLQECIVGLPDNATVPSLTPLTTVCIRPALRPFFAAHGGKYWADVLPDGHWKALQNEISEFCNVLKGEGVKVVRPDSQDFQKVYSTPNFSSHGLYAAMPRDLILVVADELIETPLAWPSRYFEFMSYRRLMKRYYDRGAKWTVAPKPLMVPEFIDKRYDLDETNGLARITTEEEICFDAADFFRCGRDIFGQRSQVTNSASIHWLRRHVRHRGIRVHELNFYDANSMHVDATLVPVKPGVFLKNPKYACVESHMFNNCGWDMVDVPKPLISDDMMYMSSNYLAMNTLTMDCGRVFCERDETGIQKLFESLGMKPIPVKLKHAFAIGGGFHCWTCDIKRKGNLESHFNWQKSFLDQYDERYGR